MEGRCEGGIEPPGSISHGVSLGTVCTALKYQMSIFQLRSHAVKPTLIFQMQGIYERKHFQRFVLAQKSQWNSTLGVESSLRNNRFTPVLFGALTSEVSVSNVLYLDTTSLQLSIMFFVPIGIT